MYYRNMDFPPAPPPDPESSLLSALTYSARFKYPLTQKEIWLWQPGTNFPQSFFKNWPHSFHGLNYLPGGKANVAMRHRREVISQKKISYLQKHLWLFRLIPTIKAVYVTGSVAVRNSSPKDDIDLMIITSHNCVWLTRLMVVLLLSLFSLRRSPGLPEHSSDLVSDKICDNLYLDEYSLVQPHHPHNYSRSLYVAHEILQAWPIWSKPGLEHRFLSANSWVKKYLPVAYSFRYRKLSFKPSSPVRLATLKLFVNLFLFFCQYLYMRRRFTHEVVGLNHAFFHPRKVLV